MKSKIKILILLLTVGLALAINPEQTSGQENSVNFQVFYDGLSPYGQWVDYGNYGYAWIPDVGSDFVPYSSEGHWILTDAGWTWASDYEWGWAPFHYGRWFYDNSYGWLWVPGTEWGPAWVNWRSANGYYGWSPMEPGISLSVGFGRSYNSNYDHWMFVRDRDFDRANINRYFVNRTDHDRIVRQSKAITTTYLDKSRNFTYVIGPNREDVQRVTGRKINSVVIRENSKPGQKLNNGQLQIYRPRMIKNSDNGHKPVPTKIGNIKDIKRPSVKNEVTQPAKADVQSNRNKVQTSQPRNATSIQNNTRIQQPKSVKPITKAKVQSAQPQKTVQGIKKVNAQSPKPASSQIKKVQSQQPTKAIPSNKRGRLQPPKTVQSPVRKAQPSQSRPTTPPNNSGRVQQPNNVRPTSATPARSAQPRPATPAGNSGRQQQPNVAKPQNNSPNERAK